MKRVILSSTDDVVAGKLLDKFMDAIAKGFSQMLKGIDFKAKPEEVEVDGKPGVKYIIQVEEVSPEFLKKGIKNPKTGRESGDVSVTFCNIPDSDDKVIMLIEPDESNWRSSLKPVTSKPLNKGQTNEFFQDWLDKYDLYISTDEEGREEILDEHDLEDDEAADKFKAASTQIRRQFVKHPTK